MRFTYTIFILFLTLFIAFFTFVSAKAQSSSIQNKLTEEKINDSQIYLNNVDSQKDIVRTSKSMLPGNIEIRKPSGEIWERIPWDNEQINFMPTGTAIPAGDLNGNGLTDLIQTFYAPDERTDDLSDMTPKTVIFFGGNISTSADHLIYEELIPAGDINGSGKANLIQQTENGFNIYEFSGSGYSVSNSTIDISNDNLIPLYKDLDGSGSDDLIQISGDTLTVIFGDSDNQFEIKKYDLPNDVLEGNGVSYSGTLFNWAYQGTYQKEENKYVLISNMVQHDIGEQNGYLNVLRVNQNRDIILEQHFKLSEAYLLTGSIFQLQVSEEHPSLLYTNQFESFNNETDHNTFRIIPAEHDEEGNIFEEQIIPFYEGLAYPVGDLIGDGNSEFILHPEGNANTFSNLFLGRIGDNLSIEKGESIGHQYDEIGIRTTNTSPFFYCDFTGDGNDNYIIQITFVLINGEEYFGQLLIGTDGNEVITEEAIVYPREDFQRRIAYDVYALGDMTGNGVDDFVVNYRIETKTELSFHEGGATWQTPFQIVELGENELISDVVSGFFTSQDNPDIAMVVRFYDDNTRTWKSEIRMMTGGASIASEPFWVLEPEFYYPGQPEHLYLDEFFGIVENAGDVNGSGFDDLLVSAAITGSVPAGLFLGGEGFGGSEADHYFHFEDDGLAGMGIGGTLKGLGDINGGGLDDFAIVNLSEGIFEDFTETGSSGGGRINIFFGKEDADFSEPDRVLRSSIQSLADGNDLFYFGMSEIAVGDFSGDGLPDIAAAPLRMSKNSDPLFGIPGVHFFFGESDSTEPDTLLGLKREYFSAIDSSENESEYISGFGRGQMAGVPDLTGNGHDEFLVNGGPENTNAVLYHIDSTISNDAAILFEAPNQAVSMGGLNTINSHFRTPMGDFTGDGKLNFLAVQRSDANYKDTPVYLFDLEETAVSRDQITEKPSEFSLQQNYPNPFNPVTTIRYFLSQPVDVQLEVFNVLGQRVATLINDQKPAGRHEVNFDASNLSSGMYIYRITAGEFVQTRKMVLVK